jgi:hypothetical protein
MIIYAAMYNGMIHESCFGLISLHRTQKGAEMAIAFHQKEIREEEKNDKHVSDFMAWRIFEYVLWE